MAVPKKVDGRWQHRVMVKGKRTSGTFDTKAQALAWEAEQRTAKDGGNATTQTCKDAFDRYEREVSKGKKGYRWEALRLASFSRSDLGAVRVVDLNASHIAKWRDTRLKTVLGSTVNREMNIISNVFTVARKEWKWITESPTGDVKRPKESPPRFRRVHQEEIEQLCHVLGWCNTKPKTKNQAVAAAFLFALETGMRAGEICILRKGDVVGAVAHLRGGVVKNGLARDAPLTPRAVEIWKMLPDGFGIDPASLDALFRKAKKATTIVDLTFHDSRHEATTRLAKKLHVLDLARVIGHKDIRKLMIYYNESAADIAAKL
ncbi:MAG: tyrosine-type recombinase/integrase [Pseudomonadota bacterium]